MKTRKIQSRAFSSILLTVLIIAAALLSSCDLNEKQIENPELIRQSFQIESVYSMSAKKSVFDPASWLYNYTTVIGTMTLTGENAATGNIYSQDVTIAQLQAGTVVFNMLPGDYHVTFETTHERTAHPDHITTYTVESLNTDGAPVMADVIDIAIDNNLTLLGTPIQLTATVLDYLIIVDLMDQRFTSSQFASSTTDRGRLIFDASGDWTWGYFDSRTTFGATGFRLNVVLWNTPAHLASTNFPLDCSTFTNGKVYIIQSPFGGTVELNIPTMETVNVVLPTF